MRCFVRNIGRGIKKVMDEKIKTCQEILSSAQNRLIMGLVILGLGVGLGGGLIASAYIRVPKEEDLCGEQQDFCR